MLYCVEQYKSHDTHQERNAHNKFALRLYYEPSSLLHGWRVSMMNQSQLKNCICESCSSNIYIARFRATYAVRRTLAPDPDKPNVTEHICRVPTIR